VKVRRITAFWYRNFNRSYFVFFVAYGSNTDWNCISIQWRAEPASTIAALHPGSSNRSDAGRRPGDRIFRPRAGHLTVLSVGTRAGRLDRSTEG
jgi:hypothetical protein